ncbi:MAG: hypothetical protein ACYC1L_19455 [Alphaproteobacteria bacterium]
MKVRDRIDSHAIVKGLIAALASFLIIGTVTALWPNPIFIRMTSAGGWEISLLAVQSVLLGIYFAVRRPACKVRVAGAGGVLNFLGVACPVCNKVLLLIFGWDALMAYFEPVRLPLAALGVLVTFLAVVGEWRRGEAELHAPMQKDVATDA